MPNNPTKKRKMGRPTKYKPEYAEQLIQFFNVPLTTTKIKTYTTKAGTVIEEEIKEPNIFPTFERFACDLETSTQVLIEWTKRFPDFNDAYTRAKLMQKNFLLQSALPGRYNPVFAKFAAVNLTDMRDQVSVEHSGLEDALGSLAAKRKRGK